MAALMVLSSEDDFVYAAARYRGKGRLTVSYWPVRLREGVPGVPPDWGIEARYMLDGLEQGTHVIVFVYSEVYWQGDDGNVTVVGGLRYRLEAGGHHVVALLNGMDGPADTKPRAFSPN